MKRSFILFFTLCSALAQAQKASQAEAMTRTVMNTWKDSFLLPGDRVAKWRYDQGVILKGIEGLWNVTGNGDYFRYIQKSMDHYVTEDGNIRGYKPDEYNIDHINNGKLLLLLYQVSGKEKYRKAAASLRAQLNTHPRTSGGSFFHKKIYDQQVWLDGLYMGQPFYAEYAKMFGEDSAFHDIARQFTSIERHARDPKTGLLYHGWDASRKQKWADPKTGLSPHVWGRAMGWYGMALVDVLDHFPAKHPGRDSIMKVLGRFAKAVTAVQDAQTGLWYDVMDRPKAPKNYFEASASSMLVYTLAKGVRMGYLPASYLPAAKKGYAGILKEFIKVENGQTNLHGTVSVSGLGGNPYRDGSFDYYMSEPVIVNDPKGIGAFILAANEMEMLSTQTAATGKTVLLDYYFNNEWKPDATGRNVRYHYTWEDKSNSGFSMLGHIFRKYGFHTRALETAPTAAALANAGVYILVDPDTEKETKQPHFMDAAGGKVIADWVRNGGVLVMMANDAGNAELTKFNTLALRFGIHFNPDNYNLVEGNQFEQGAVLTSAGNPVFEAGRKLYIKELATLQLGKPATAIVTKEGKNVIAIANYGKGKVFAIGDPWLYNEYVDGRKLPADFHNYAAAEDLVRWLSKVAKR